MLAGKLGFFGGAFTPRSIANLGAWWDCSDATRYTLVSSVVSSFTDSTGTYTITQSTAANRPSISSINGKGAFSFNGSSTALFNTTAVASPWGTYFWVAQSAVADANGHSIMGMGTNTPAVATAAFGMGTTGTNWMAANRIGGTTSSVSGFVVTANTPRVGTAVIPNSSSITLRINGVAGGSSGGGASSNSAGICLGARLVNSAPTILWSGVIGEVIWYSRTLSASEISQVESYLAVRWGIAF